MNGMRLLDAAMITGDALLHPINIGAVMILAPPRNSGEHFADRLYHQTLAQPVVVDRLFRRVPHRSPGTGGLWVWREERDLDVGRHLTRRTLPDGSGSAELWQLIGTLHAQRLDRSRPMWAAFLIDGLADGRLAFYVKAQHVMVDGVAGMRLIGSALSTDPDRRAMPPFYAERDHPPATAGARWDLSAPLRRLAGLAGSGITALARIPESQACAALAMVTGRATVPAVGAPFTPFNTRLGPHRGVIAASWAKSRIRAVQEITGTTAHDVATAVVGGALRDWLSDHGDLPRRSLVAFCPISVRAHDPANNGAGNRFGAWLCPMGTDLADPLKRLRRVHRSMVGGKRYVARYGSAGSLSLAAPSIASTIVQALVPAGPRISTGYNLPMSSVPGPGAEMYWNGAHVEEIYPVSAVFDGQTLNVTVCSYADRIGIGYVADSDVMPDIATMVSRTGRALSELESAVGAGPPRG
ncbi:wax ester/triacylglycerol synthase family O-acyltransferase [Mycolicibacter hiberniae]|uniref:Diacylglycerol O-acyltransferase n=1 Tax=Mycolicibacter hiberniae TaxID=29314 RepID=A0A7I7X7R3_9MYCO|nr:wax ester/triacylglycerol synthase family O-acyltransferase [Mycolicibacter hiberniae]MCV7087203.1 wax ester/triacylglycerol synthase family O-acyltransferase [Mycolicibacter hiberniae]ORV67805.1 diacylglycerol O-acyltransferase [Mycolicibacter hiberniae]BBZ25584.1 diacylglycerol O-acyltransferase [Mycolicibacter hiberniae]